MNRFLVLKIKNKKVKLEMSQAVASVGQIHLINEFQKIHKAKPEILLKIIYGKIHGDLNEIE